MSSSAQTSLRRQMAGGTIPHSQVSRSHRNGEGLSLAVLMGTTLSAPGRTQSPNTHDEVVPRGMLLCQCHGHSWVKSSMTIFCGVFCAICLPSARRQPAASRHSSESDFVCVLLSINAEIAGESGESWEAADDTDTGEDEHPIKQKNKATMSHFFISTPKSRECWMKGA